jgi:alkylation response protein AidB-like acyl-CoA dehydrogenase
MMTIAERIGWAGVVSPFVWSSAVATRALSRLDSCEALARHRHKLAAGESIATIAFHEDDTYPTIFTPHAHAVREGDGYHLNGRKRIVPFGADAQLVLVPAMLEKELALFAVDVSRQDYVMRRYAAVDRTPCADLCFKDALLSSDALLACGRQARDLLEWMQDAWIAALCADAVGAMRRVIEMTGSYLKVRQQFGRTLSSNQALRHRFVDLDMDLAQAETVSEWAAAVLDTATAPERHRAICTAHYTVVKAAWKISQEAVQMHGGIGMADETPVGLYFKRLLTMALVAGDEDRAILAYDQKFLETA